MVSARVGEELFEIKIVEEAPDTCDHCIMCTRVSSDISVRSKSSTNEDGGSLLQDLEVVEDSLAGQALEKQDFEFEFENIQIQNDEGER